MFFFNYYLSVHILLDLYSKMLNIVTSSIMKLKRSVQVGHISSVKQSLPMKIIITLKIALLSFFFFKH